MARSATRPGPHNAWGSAISGATDPIRTHIQSVNRVTLIGRLTDDIRLRHTTSGIPVVSFSLATNDQLTVEFHDVVAWRELAEIAFRLTRKGHLVQVEGYLHGRNWKTKEGQNRRTVEIVAETLRVLRTGSATRS